MVRARKRLLDCPLHWIPVPSILYRLLPSPPRHPRQHPTSIILYKAINYTSHALNETRGTKTQLLQLKLEEQLGVP